jgi:hypothetical protein
MVGGWLVNPSTVGQFFRAPVHKAASYRVHEAATVSTSVINFNPTSPHSLAQHSTMPPLPPAARTQFHPFHLLPLELQRQIFLYAFPLPTTPLLITLTNNPPSRTPQNLLTSHPLLTTLSQLHHPALPSPKPSIISLKTLSSVTTEVGIRIELDILFLPILRTLDIEHFLSVERNRRVRNIALRARDVEDLPVFFEDPPSIAARLIFNLPHLETVYAVEGERVGDDVEAREGVLEEVPEHVRGGVPGTRHHLRGGDVWDSMEMGIAELNWRLVVNRERKRRGVRWEDELRVPRVVYKRVRWVNDGEEDTIAWSI